MADDSLAPPCKPGGVWEGQGHLYTRFNHVLYSDWLMITACEKDKTDGQRSRIPEGSAPEIGAASLQLVIPLIFQECR